MDEFKESKLGRTGLSVGRLGLDTGNWSMTGAAFLCK